MRGSRMPRRMWDTSSATVEESLSEFIQQVAPVLNDRVRTAILVKKALKAGDWPHRPQDVILSGSEESGAGFRAY